MPPVKLQGLLWQEACLDSAGWWHSTWSKQLHLDSDIRHERSQGEGLWRDCWQRSARVGSKREMWDSGGMNQPPESVSALVEGRGNFTAGEVRGEVEKCRKLLEDGRVADAIDALHILVQQGFQIPSRLFYRALKKCIALKDLALGRRIHAISIENGFEGDAFLATHLIGLYASRGTLDEAMKVFSKVPVPDAYNWASVIFANARHGEPAQAIRLYRQMRDSAVQADNRIFVAVLKACAAAGDVMAGKEVHAHILASAEKPDSFVQNGLLHMYAKCRNLDEARIVFDRLPSKDVVTWTAMIAGYTQQGMGQEALSLYRGMQQEGLSPPDSVAFVCLLQACASVGVGALHEGKQLHLKIQERGLQNDVVLGGSLVNMYAKCGSLEVARNIFDKLPSRNVITWTSMIAGYAQQGRGHEALRLYSGMQQEGLTPPNSVTFVCLLQACASVGREALQQGKQLHAQVQDQGLHKDVVVGGSLVNMYTRCGSLEDARSIFDRLPNKNVVTWTTMIAGYADQGMGEDALGLYSTMRQVGLAPSDSAAFVCLLQACASVGVAGLQEGKQLHALIETRGLQHDLSVGCSLVSMYAKCGSLAQARSIFDRLPERDTVTWNAMLGSYIQQGMAQEALDLYNNSMNEGALFAPSVVTFVCLLQACACVGVGALHQGQQIHAQVVTQGLHDDVVLGCSLVNMYAKCGSLADARSIFDRLPRRSVVTWTAMIAGYSQRGMYAEALCFFSSMQQEGLLDPNPQTYVCLLQSCAHGAGLLFGQQIHAHIQERGMQSDVVVGAALVNMYAKCGSMFASQEVFDSLPERTMEAWGALIGGYAREGNCEQVFALFDRMRLEGTQPDGVTFLAVLTVCSHAGLVDEGHKYFKAMRTDHGVRPTVEHYACMVDMLGRAGHLDEAMQMAKSMPFRPTGSVWHTLLGACWKWRNVEIGEQAFDHAVSLDEKHAGSYVLMANIYAKAGMWEEAEEMQTRRKKYGAWKEPGQSWWIDMRGVVHTFVAGDKQPFLNDGISAEL